MGCCSSDKQPAIILFPENRHCTDIIWILVFALMGALAVLCVIYSGTTSDLKSYIDATPQIHWDDYWELIGICTGFSFLFTLILTAIMQYLTRAMVYFSLVLGTAIVFALVCWFWYIYATHKADEDLIIAIMMTIGVVVWIILVMYIWGKLDLVLTLYEIAANIIMDQPMILVISCVIFLIYLAGSVAMGSMILVILSAKWEAARDRLETKNNTQYLLNAFLALEVFIGLWFLCFVFACSKYLIGHVVGTWYFTTDKKSLNKPIMNATKSLFRYHTGSMLFGSFVMAVIHFFKILLEYIRNMKSQNVFLNCMAMVAICLIECCKTFWDLLSTNAYYLVAMFGLSFCSALNLGTELTSLGITSLFYVIGNMMVNVGIVVVVVASSAITISAFDYDIPEENMWQAYLLMILIGLCISSVILTVYSTVTRALYVCVCVDIRQSPNLPFTKVPGLLLYIEKTQTNIIRNENMV